MRRTSLFTGVILAGLVLSSLLQSGCRRSSRAPVATSPASTQVSQAVEELNYALQEYRDRNGKMPNSIEELLTASKLPRPQLPAGTQLQLNKRYLTVEVAPQGER